MLKILNGGVYSSIQDLGRFGYAKYGVPVSGMLDQYSGRLANLILRNSLTDAVLEVTNYGCSFQFLRETIICITGADLKPVLNGKSIILNHPIKIKANSILKFEKRLYGIRSYIGVKDGFLNKPVLESRSFFKAITKKYILRKDDEILYETYKDNLDQLSSSVKINTDHFEAFEFEAYKGPEYNLLDNTQKELLAATEFTISRENSRMGYKLTETLKNELDTMLTSAMLPGTVQLTPSGKLIVLMRDCGVTGGYPRVLLLTDDSVNKMAQKTTNDQFKFKLVDLE